MRSCALTDLPARRELVPTDDCQRLAELRTHRRRGTEHERRDQALDLFLQWSGGGYVSYCLMQPVSAPPHQMISPRA
jgi:hypothetical protein